MQFVCCTRRHRRRAGRAVDAARAGAEPGRAEEEEGTATAAAAWGSAAGGAAVEAARPARAGARRTAGATAGAKRAAAGSAASRAGPAAAAATADHAGSAGAAAARSAAARAGAECAADDRPVAAAGARHAAAAADHADRAAAASRAGFAAARRSRRSRRTWCATTPGAGQCAAAARRTRCATTPGAGQCAAAARHSRCAATPGAGQCAAATRRARRSRRAAATSGAGQRAAAARRSRRCATTTPGALPPPPAPTAAQTPLRPVGPGGAAAGIAPQTAQGKPVLRVDGLRAERHETREGDRTIIREPDRIIVRENDGHAFIRHNEVDRFRFNALNVRVERRGNDNVTIVDRPGGERIVTVLAPDGRLMRRSRVFPDGREVIIIDERGPPVASVFVTLPPPVIRIPRERYIVEAEVATPAMIYDTLVAPPIERLERPYSLDEIRYSYPLRERMPSIDIDTINFDSGSWEVAPDQVDRLSVIAEAISKAVARNPREVFLVEGHTDAVGNDVDNLSLSDRRAETVGLVLSDKFQVPPENLVTQGYGEQYLKIPSQGPERRNRRVTVRRITPLLAGGTS